MSGPGTSNASSPVVLNLRRDGQVLRDILQQRILNIPRPEKRPVRQIFSEFALTTTCHGIPHIERSRTRIRRLFWTVVFIICLIIFSILFFLMISKFLRFDKTVEIKIKFEQVDFPAVTICNLNPFKKSYTQNVASVQKSIDVFENAVNFAQKRKNDQKAAAAASADQLPPLSTARRRFLRQVDPDLDHDEIHDRFIIRYQTIRTSCNCDAELYCEPTNVHLRGTNASYLHGGPAMEDVMCLCFFDAKTLSQWPCYLARQWSVMQCSDCHEAGYCSFPTPGEKTVTNDTQSCVCRRASKFCLVKPLIVTGTKVAKDGTLEVVTEAPDRIPLPPPKRIPESTAIPKRFTQYGFNEDTTDKSAMQSKAQENLIFAVSELDYETKVNLSYTKGEQLKQCSFAGKDCKEQDFVLHLDPSYGNCYTFNHNATHPMAASRPGALYGLRVLWFVNKTDYLSTTVASGVKISVHHQMDYPFPDTFGYSAPTGFLSSFAVKKQLIERLSRPYGDCLKDEDFDINKEEYLYGSRYSMEGCHRMCVQRTLIEICGCADARFLLPENARYCAANNAKERQCLVEILDKVTAANSEFCADCRQPCRKIYCLKDEITMFCGYAEIDVSGQKSELGSLVRPLLTVTTIATTCSQSLSQLQTGPPKLPKEEAVFIEVYFEQVNYQHLIEHEAYGYVNLLADFGGYISLFLGISIITMVEFCVLIYELITSGIWRRDNRNPVYFLRIPGEKNETHQADYDFMTDHVDMNVTLQLDEE